MLELEFEFIDSKKQFRIYALHISTTHKNVLPKFWKLAGFFIVYATHTSKQVYDINANHTQASLCMQTLSHILKTD